MMSPLLPIVTSLQMLADVKPAVVLLHVVSQQLVQSLLSSPLQPMGRLSYWSFPCLTASARVMS